MYILKNAFRNITRAKGRNILIGIIIFIISVSLCIGLSIRQAATNARENALEGMSITAQISVDRTAMMKNAGGQPPQNDGERPSFDKSSFKGFSESLTVEEMQTYASASTVSDFYYTLTSSFNSTDEFEAVTNSTTETSTEAQQVPNNMPNDTGGRNNMMGGKGAMTGNGDFSVIGYSSDTAMTDFVDGNSTISEGTVFEQGTSELQCIISQELATYNSTSIGDTITLTNPNVETEEYELTVVGIYETSQATDTNPMSQMFSFADPSNEIYMSYNALKSIVDNSESVATTTTSDNGMTQSTAVFSQTSGTYEFETVEDYEKFCEEVYELGLSEDYTVSSTDITQYEQSLVPLETLSTIAGYFLIVIIAIGALILIVLNIFSIRERKYEIGVLTAIGMKKSKVAMQFICEILLVTLMAVIIGGAVGAVSSVPVANVLLENQITSQQQASENQMMAFGREMGGRMEFDGANPPEMPDNMNKGNIPQGDNNFVSEINSSVNIVVLLQLLGICILLALLASAVSVTAIMRYDPLRILSNRD